MTSGFPIGQLRQPEAALRRLQADATTLLRSFDPRCSVQVKLGAGPLATGALGPPGDERPDVIGSALNRLVKLPWADVVISPEAVSLLAGQLPSGAPPGV